MPHIIRRPSWYLPDSAATPEPVFRNRRAFLKKLGLAGIAAAGLPLLRCQGLETAAAGHEITSVSRNGVAVHGPVPEFEKPAAFADAGRPITDEKLVAGFNNFYEFSYVKERVQQVAENFTIEPYTLVFDGLVDEPVTLDLAQIEKLGMEERVYRFRCVEAWGMTVPWLGVPFAKVLERVAIKPEAKYIAFKSFYNPDEAPNQRDKSFTWPYYEGLRVDEAMNELAFVTTGMYGKRLPPQNGTPLRIILPWKYGFKGPKSVVRMTFTDRQPATFWNDALPHEYKFFSNVEPDIPHPRWPQDTEWHLDTGKGTRYPTQLYNGYMEQVAHLYDRDTELRPGRRLT